MQLRLVASVLMFMAGDAGIFQAAGEPLLRDLLHFAGTAPEHLDAVAVEHVDRALAHVARQHHAHAHLRQGVHDIGFAPAPCRRHDLFLFYDLVFFICRKYREISTVPEVGIYAVLD